MSWVLSLQSLLGTGNYADDLFPDLYFGLEELFTQTSFTTSQVEGCALAAAVASGNYNMWMTMYSLPYGGGGGGFFNNSNINLVDRRAGVRAGALAAQSNVYYNLTDQYEPLKAIPDRLRDYMVYMTGGTSKIKFDSYMLAGHLVGPCNICITAYITVLKEQGYTLEQLSEIGRIASVIKAVSNIFPGYTPPPPVDNSNIGGA